MKKLINETMEYLKEKVAQIESEILLLTDGGTARCVSDDKGAYLVKLIEERKDTLDALFRATPNEVMRMDKLNDQLKAITRQMHERVAIVNEDAAKIFVDGNLEVEGRLNYNPNAASAIRQLENDEYFGSDFAKIHQVIDMLFDQGYLPIKCADFVRASDLVNDFDNGKWETAYEDWLGRVFARLNSLNFDHIKSKYKTVKGKPKVAQQGIVQGTEPYYVRMGVAWLLATALAKFPDQTRAFVRSSNLPADVVKLYIRKVRESFRTRTVEAA